MRLAVVARRPSPTNASLAAVRCSGLRAEVLTPEEAIHRLRPRDVALGRLDVLRTLDGVDDGLWALGVLAARGVTVLNGPEALLAAHDKLLTARLLRRAGLPHPRSHLIAGDRPQCGFEPPVVLKPRFGSWGQDVVRCDDRAALDDALGHLRRLPWYRTSGALVQELVPHHGRDLRLVVAGDRVVGAISRVAPPGEWRTNVTLGAVREQVEPAPETVRLALEAARTLGASLIGVDLLPLPTGGWTIIELNGAVEFTHEYAPGRDVFADTCLALRQAMLDRQRRDDAALAPV
jgi:RimK family alpha-L-glutamate ligase